jgi:hypothetical protein
MKKLFLALKISTRPNFWFFALVIFASLLAGRGLMGVGYFNMHDDLQMMRQLQLEKCFLDFQIPCRWVPDMGYGFGYPLFNFYPPLPYLVGQGIRIIGFSFTSTVKILFISSFVVSGVTMYLLAKEFFGRLAGAVSAIFYIWAPYHAVDVYVRGAMNEAWALMWFPLILYSSYKLISGPSEALPARAGRAKEGNSDHFWILILALSWFALFTSHNLMVLIFGPVFAIWLLLWLVLAKAWHKIPQLALAGIWSFGLAAFFTLPVLLEKNLVQTDTLVVGYYEYTAHFVSISQLFLSRFWGYGPSVWNVVDDGMPFQIGWAHWITAIIVGFLILVKLLRLPREASAKWGHPDAKGGYSLVSGSVSSRLRNILNDKPILATTFMLCIAAFATLMTHNKSTPIWQAIKSLEFVQFPWRFLTITILGVSFAAGYLVKTTPKLLRPAASVILAVVVIAYSFNYFLPEHGKLGPLTDQKKFEGAAWELQQTAGIYDYLPNTAKTAPKAPQTGTAQIVSGSGEVTTAIQGTDWAIIKVKLDEDSTIRLGILQFPNWTVKINGQKMATYVPESEDWGRIHFNAPAGDHTIDVNLQNTQPRVIGNVISTLSWLLVIGSVVELKRGKKK